MKTRNVAVIAGGIVANVIVIEDSDEGRAFLFGPHGPTVETTNSKGESVLVRPEYVDVTDLPPGKHPGIDWKIAGSRGEESRRKLAENAEKAAVVESEKEPAPAASDAPATIAEGKLESADDSWSFEPPPAEALAGEEKL